MVTKVQKFRNNDAVSQELIDAAGVLRRGGIVAYPTEAVYGLGCDPENEAAVARVLRLKRRAAEKGLIIVACTWEQLVPWVGAVPADRLVCAQATWPGAVTWIFPKGDRVPAWISGAHETVAVRVTAHPVARALCAAFGGPVVSTSANPEGRSPARDRQALRGYFPRGVDFILSGELGTLKNPTEIRDILTGGVLRSA